MMRKVDLVGLMAEQIQQENRGDDWGRDNLHISDLGASPLIQNPKDRKCARKIWLRYHGKPYRPASPGKLLMYEVGHMMEKKALEYLRQAEKRSYFHNFMIGGTQVDVSEGVPVLVGHADIVISQKYSLDPELIVVDVKSRKTNVFDDYEGIRPAEKYQVGGYIYGLRNLGKKATTGCILEVDKSGANFARHNFFRYTSNFEKQIKSTIDYLCNMVEGEMPERKELINTNAGLFEPWQCKWCDFKEVSCDGAILPERL